MSSSILAVDLGTQSLRASAVSAAGQRIWTWTRPVATRTDGALGEQDPAEWAVALDDALAEAARAGVRPVAVAASGPLAGYVPIDGDGVPLAPAAMYFDRRSQPDLAALEAEEGPRADGLRPTIADPVPHLMRIRRERADLLPRLAHLLDSTGYLVHRLTGRPTLDVYTSLRLPGPDLGRRLGIDLSLFGETVRLGERVGDLSQHFARAFGGYSIPVIAATFDSKCAYVASGLSQDGEALDISGTVTSFGVFSRQRVIDAARRIYAVPYEDGWLARGSMGATGGVLEWFARTFLPGGSAEDVFDLARLAPPGALGVTFLPFHAGARSPVWNPAATGGFEGLTLESSRPALARAVVESFAFGLRHIVDTLAGVGVATRDVRFAGGLARSEVLSQIKADVLGRPMLRMADHELTTTGLAVICFSALGAYPSRRHAADVMARVSDRFEPRVDPQLYAEPYARYCAAASRFSVQQGPGVQVNARETCQDDRSSPEMVYQIGEGDGRVRRA